MLDWIGSSFSIEGEVVLAGEELDMEIKKKSVEWDGQEEEAWVYRWPPSTTRGVLRHRESRVKVWAAEAGKIKVEPYIL